MLLNDYDSDDTSCSTSSPSEGEILESEREFQAYTGSLMMVRRLLGSQPVELEQSQRENPFHTRCKVFENICSGIVDTGSYCNCCSSRLVDKLALTIVPHTKSYKLQCIKDYEGIVVKNQVSIPISMGNYNGNVLCDVVPMEVGHILLGRPWKFDKHAIHDGLTNKISFHHKGKKLTLSPLSPQ